MSVRAPPSATLHPAATPQGPLPTMMTSKSGMAAKAGDDHDHRSHREFEEVTTEQANRFEDQPGRRPVLWQQPLRRTRTALKNGGGDLKLPLQAGIPVN